MKEHKNAVRMFSEFIGGELSLKSITKKSVIDYKQALLQTPNRYTMRSELLPENRTVTEATI